MPSNRTAMSSVDTAWLRMESPESPMMIGAVLVFDEPIDIGKFRNLLEERFLRFHRFRQRVVCKSDRWYWEDDPGLTWIITSTSPRCPGRWTRPRSRALSAT